MRARRWLNLALAGVVTLLAFFAWRTPQSPDTYAVSRKTPESVATVRIERPGQASVVLQGQNGAWRMRQPFAARANPERLQRLLDFLRARAERRLPAENLARYDLDKPLLTLAFDDERFLFGPTAPLDGRQYVANGAYVYLLDPRLALAAYGRPGDFADPRLLEDGARVVAIDTATLKARLDAAGHWQLTPANETLSQDRLNRWADAWRLADAIGVEPRPPGKALGTLRLGLRDGRAIELEILATTPEFVLVRQDEGLAYHFPAQAAASLLAPR
jgi:hypothetical protein